MKSKEITFYLSIVLLVLVILLLIYAHLGETTVGKSIEHKSSLDIHPGVWVCDDAPFCKGKDLVVVLNWWDDLGYKVADIDSGPCEDQCLFTIDGVDRWVKCKEGWISITLEDQWYNDVHADETLQSYGATKPVILLPSELHITPDYVTTQNFPMAVCAHALGHAFNKTHATGPLGAAPTGHIMHPYTQKLGWGDAGL